MEAVSRGAARTVFGDRDPEALRCLGRNLERMAGEYEILRGDWSDTLDKLSRRGETFDVVFLDPPYEAGLYAPVLRRLEELRLLADGAVVCIESDRELTFAGYAVRKERRYGLVHVYLLEVCP